MICRVCGEKTIVIDTRTIDNGKTVRRRRYCEYCEAKFTTYETDQKSRNTEEMQKKLVKVGKMMMDYAAAMRATDKRARERLVRGAAVCMDAVEMLEKTRIQG